MTGRDVESRPDPTMKPTVAFTLRPIGIVHVTARKRVPGSRYFVPMKRATLEFFQPYVPGLQGLYEGIEVWVITYHAPSGRIPMDAWQVWDGVPGVFATTSLERPNPIEFLRARIAGVDREKGLLQIVSLDVEDGAAILDIRLASSPHRRLTRPGE